MMERTKAASKSYRKHTDLSQSRKLTEQVQRPIKSHLQVLKASSRLPPVDQPDVRLLPPQSLKQAKKNARTHSKKQITQVADSIRQFGCIAPIVADEDGRIICGHARCEAAKQLGLKVVPVQVLRGRSDAEKRALALADNKIPANAGWDRKLLAEELGELASLLPECNLSLDITGFAPAEIDGLMTDFGDVDQDSAGAPCVIAEQPISRRGELWRLGQHRVLCGDACDQADWAALVGKDLAAVVVSDPPYNLRIGTTLGRGKIKHREFQVASGEMSSPEFTDFLTSWMRLAVQFSHDRSMHYIFMDWRHLGEMHGAGHAVFGPLQNLVVWNKTNAGQGSFYRSQHELIFVYRNGEAPHLNNVELGRHGRSRSNVWTYAGVNTFRQGRLADLTVHPTVKPVALIADAIKDCTRRGDLVLDPFLGSGTTLLAAERVGRKAYGLEIDPLYVDAAIRRWQDVTRRDAILAATGQTFEEVAAERSAATAGSST
ncbi:MULTISPECIES: DNA methyltransferase [unclassified Bradyrhizobium]|uniref:site-specific DNA-methyltransferase n=1 Tax=unclassified Bradyrhizobium TaxID=2631580 RepID=UPI001FFF7983|nr:MULTISPECIES: DNA methyltransferase [unclassified Bradyrhizobium]